LNDQNRSDLFKGIEKGVVVRTIQADTPAAKSDLRPADVITDVDGVAVTSARELQNEVLKKKIGTSVTLGVWRDGKKMTVAIRTEASPTEANRIASNAPPGPEGQANNQNFGLQVQDITPQLKQELELKADSGVVITDIVPNSPAAVADVKPGDVITEVDRVPVNNTEAFQRALASQKGKSNLLLLLDRKGVKTYSIVKAK
jgi:S1-C subfamily serine protease